MIAFSLFAAAAPIHADIVFYRNQRYVKGRVVNQTINGIVFKKRSGETITIPKKKIRKILYINDSAQSELDREAAEQKKRFQAQRRAREAARKRTEAARAKAERERLEKEKKEKAAEIVRRRKEAQDRLKKDREQTSDLRRQSLWRSAILPGWGQHYRGSRKKAQYIGGSAAVAGLFLFIFNRRYDRATQEFNDANTLALAGINDSSVAAAGFLAAESAREKVSLNASRARLFFRIFLGIYAYNLYDAWFNAGTGARRPAAAIFTSPDAGLSFFLQPDLMPADNSGERLGVSYSLRF